MMIFRENKYKFINTKIDMMWYLKNESNKLGFTTQLKF